MRSKVERCKESVGSAVQLFNDDRLALTVEALDWAFCVSIVSRRKCTAVISSLCIYVRYPNQVGGLNFRRTQPRPELVYESNQRGCRVSAGKMHGVARSTFLTARGGQQDNVGCTAQGTQGS